MKKIIILHIFTFSFFMQAQSFRGLDKSPLDMVNFPASSQIQEKVLRVLYSRPQLKGRNLKTLIPNGKLWRTGANESTEITFFKDVEIDSKSELFLQPGGRHLMLFGLKKKLNEKESFVLKIHLKNKVVLETNILVLDKKLKANFLN